MATKMAVLEVKDTCIGYLRAQLMIHLSVTTSVQR